MWGLKTDRSMTPNLLCLSADAYLSHVMFRMAALRLGAVVQGNFKSIMAIVTPCRRQAFGPHPQWTPAPGETLVSPCRRKIVVSVPSATCILQPAS